MLTPYLRSQFVTKILTSATGEQYKVVFLVALVNGEVKAQVVSATPLSKKESVLCLPVVKIDENFIIFEKSLFNTPSSFVSSLEFFMSQPTRAPSL